MNGYIKGNTVQVKSLGIQIAGDAQLRGVPVIINMKNRLALQD
jgi:hypothetical protein